MRGYYIHFAGRSIKSISKKIDLQMSVFNSIGECIECELETHNRGFVQRLIGLLPIASMPWNYEKAFGAIDNPDYIYIRRTIADIGYVAFIRELRRRFSGAKIIIEVPTSPYINDIASEKGGLFFAIKEVLFRNMAYRMADRISTYSRDDVLFGRKTIGIKNGIDVSSFEEPNSSKHSESIGLLAIANIQSQHGYERIIGGLDRYYSAGNTRRVIFHLVGDGLPLPHLKEMVAKKGLEEYVNFCGFLEGEALDKMYEISDIAMVSFGDYKSNRDVSSAIKTREYLMHGLPIVSGCEEDIFDGHEDSWFYLKVPNDSSPIDIEKIVELYDNVYSGGKPYGEVRHTIYQYGVEHANIFTAFKPVIEYILEGQGDS